MYPGNHRAALPDVDRGLQHGVKDQSFPGNSTWMLDSSSQAYSGPEDNSTDPAETLTGSSTLTSVDAHAVQGAATVDLKQFVLIDDDDDGDMSLREKTVTDVSNVDGGAAELVSGRRLSTSSSTEESPPGPEAPEAQQVETAPNRKRCCFCVLL